LLLQLLRCSCSSCGAAAFSCGSVVAAVASPKFVFDGEKWTGGTGGREYAASVREGVGAEREREREREHPSAPPERDPLPPAAGILSSLRRVLSHDFFALSKICSGMSSNKTETPGTPIANFRY